MTFCMHKKVTRGNPFYAENFLCAEKFLLCRKFSLCRKFFMQKIFFMQRNFFMQKNSFYAEKISFMRKNSLYAEKYFLSMNLSQIISFSIAFMQKISFGHEPFTKQYPWLTSLSFICNIGTYN